MNSVINIGTSQVSNNVQAQEVSTTKKSPNKALDKMPLKKWKEKLSFDDQIGYIKGFELWKDKELQYDKFGIKTVNLYGKSFDQISSTEIKELIGNISDFLEKTEKNKTSTNLFKTLFNKKEKDSPRELGVKHILPEGFKEYYKEPLHVLLYILDEKQPEGYQEIKDKLLEQTKEIIRNGHKYIKNLKINDLGYSLLIKLLETRKRYQLDDDKIFILISEVSSDEYKDEYKNRSYKSILRHMEEKNSQKESELSQEICDIIDQILNPKTK